MFLCKWRASLFCITFIVRSTKLLYSPRVSQEHSSPHNSYLTSFLICPLSKSLRYNHKGWLGVKQPLTSFPIDDRKQFVLRR